MKGRSGFNTSASFAYATLLIFRKREVPAGTAFRLIVPAPSTRAPHPD